MTSATNTALFTKIPKKENKKSHKEKTVSAIARYLLFLYTDRFLTIIYIASSKLV